MVTSFQAAVSRVNGLVLCAQLAVVRPETFRQGAIPFKLFTTLKSEMLRGPFQCLVNVCKPSVGSPQRGAVCRVGLSVLHKSVGN